MEDAPIGAAVEAAAADVAASSLQQMSQAAGDEQRERRKYQRLHNHNERFTAADDAKLRQLVEADVLSWRKIGEALPYSYGEYRKGNLVKRRWEQLSAAAAATAAPSAPAAPCGNCGAWHQRHLRRLGGA